MNRLCMGCMKEYDDQLTVCPHCGYAFDSAPEQSYHIPPGSVLQQRYIVGKVLGFGGFGVTYIGWDYLMERKVAIKEYLPSEFATRMPTQQQITVYSGDREEQFKEGLLKTMDEAKRLAKFESVPGIVQIYDCFEANGTSYIVMEFLEGMSLKEYLATHGKLTVDQATMVILQIASAMEAVHKTGILHRDIAPDNIYVLNPDEPDNLQVKLLDFGAARYATTKHSKSLSVIIKPGYAPEEQYRSRGDQGTWTDVYALAATLYKMLTGITPEDAMERSVKDEVKRPSKLGVKLSKPMETALMNALNVKIQDRTQTMEEFSQELMAAEVKERSITRDKKDVGAVPVWFLGLAGAGVLVAAVLGVLMVTGVIRFRLGADTSHLEENMVRVPNVVSHEADQAEETLQQLDLGMSRDKMVFSKEIPVNRISYQEIKENTTVEKYTTVVVWISKGEEKAVIPAVRGLKREEAQKLLEKAGFTNILIEESDTPGAYDTVLEISEEQGANIELDKEITLVVCVNEENQEGDTDVTVEVPDLTDMTLEEVEAALEEAGLYINLVEEFSDQPEGIILSQEPAAGERVNGSTYISVHVSKGAEKIYMRSVQLLSEAEARAEIEALGLTVGKVTKSYSDSVAEGKVISQSVAQDTEVAKGTAVDLVISMGRDPAKQKQDAAAREREAAAAAARQQEQNQAPPQTQAPAPTQPPQTAPPETPAATQPPETAPPQTAPPETPAPPQDNGGMPDIDW